MKKTKVLIVAGSMTSGGQENQLMHIIRNADKEKFQIDFTSTEKDAFYKEEIESLGGRYYHIPHFSAKRPLRYCSAVYKILKNGGYDAVHSNELFHSGIVAAVAKLAKTPVRISHSHSGSESCGDNVGFLRKIYRRAMRCLINSCSTKRVACSTIAGKFLFGEGKPFDLLYNSVETEKFTSLYDIEIKENEYHSDGKKAILHAGHVVPLKNQAFLIETAKVLKSRNSNVHIYCAGYGEQDYVDFLNNKIAEFGVEDYITLIGLHKDVPMLMKKADAFVLPSKFEGMPLTVIEAQASGLPCVLADTFSHEVDFGLGLLDWHSLDEGAEQWAVALENAVNVQRADKADVIKAINNGGFDARLYAQKIMKLYQ